MAAAGEHPRTFSDRAALAAPFPADPHYDAKAWEMCIAKRGTGQVLFWNGAPLASQMRSDLSQEDGRTNRLPF